MDKIVDSYEFSITKSPFKKEFDFRRRYPRFRICNCLARHPPLNGKKYIAYKDGALCLSCGTEKLNQKFHELTCQMKKMINEGHSLPTLEGLLVLPISDAKIIKEKNSKNKIRIQGS